MNELLEQEIWKDIPNYEGLYQVSNFGNVKSLERIAYRKKFGNYLVKEKILKQYFAKYYQLELCKDGKRKKYFVHQLVAITFLNHKPCGYEIQVNHIDKNKRNNRLENLELATTDEHSKHTHPNKSSKYKGVCYCRNTNRWVCYISFNGKRKTLGYFDTEIEAHEKYNTISNELSIGIVSSILPKKNSSQYKGVHFHKAKNKWGCTISVNGVRKTIGYYKTEIEAYEARLEAEKQNKQNKK